MTIKELYKWAKENKVEDFELMPVEEDHNYSFDEKDLSICVKDKTIEIE